MNGLFGESFVYQAYLNGLTSFIANIA